VLAVHCTGAITTQSKQFFMFFFTFLPSYLFSVENLPKNPYFEPFLCGLSNIYKIDSLIKISHFTFNKVFIKIESLGFAEFGRTPKRTDVSKESTVQLFTDLS